MAEQTVIATLRAVLEYLAKRAHSAPGELSTSGMDAESLAKIDLTGKIDPTGDPVEELHKAYAELGKEGIGTDERIKRLEEAVNALIRLESDASELPAVEGIAEESQGSESGVVALTDDVPEYLKYKPILLPDESTAVFYGVPTAAYDGLGGETTITLDPCDAHGTDNGEDNATVYVKADQTNYAMTNSTTIPTTQIVPYVLGDDDAYYMLGTPVEVVTTYRVDGANNKLQKKTRNAWMPMPGTESGWVDVHTGDACP